MQKKKKTISGTIKKELDLNDLAEDMVYDSRNTIASIEL